MVKKFTQMLDEELESRGEEPVKMKPDAIKFFKPQVIMKPTVRLSPVIKADNRNNDIDKGVVKQVTTTAVDVEEDDDIADADDDKEDNASLIAGLGFQTLVLIGISTVALLLVCVVVYLIKLH